MQEPLTYDFGKNARNSANFFIPTSREGNGKPFPSLYCILLKVFFKQDLERNTAACFVLKLCLKPA